MARKVGIKDKVSLMLYERPDLNKKILHMKKSFDEVNSFLKKDKAK